MHQTLSTADRRIAARVDLERPVTVVADAATLAARTINVSTSGVLLASEAPLTIWAEVVLDLPGLARREARVVRRDEEQYGLVFRAPLTTAEFAALTGVALPDAPESLEAAPDTPFVRRVAPLAFGRDRVKGFQRLAAAPRKAQG